MGVANSSRRAVKLSSAPECLADIHFSRPQEVQFVVSGTWLTTSSMPLWIAAARAAYSGPPATWKIFL
ncbi:unnamed protein product [Lampetra fluviatilis]